MPSDSPFFPTDTKRDLLLLIKRRGRISLDDAVETTGLAKTTLREHLGQLERDGLISRTTVRGGRGRPSLRFGLTSEGERLFPSQDNLLLGGLLEFLEQEGENELVETFFRKFWAQRLADVEHRLSKLDPRDEKGRLKALEDILREQGFMPEIHTEEGNLVIRECNCPFPEAVKRTRLPCVLEAEFFERVLGKSVSRVAYIPDGSPACTYEFPTTGRPQSVSS